MTTATAIADETCGLRERKKQLTRRDLHRAALELAQELGVDATTVDTIAARAGVSTRTFFNYFATKDDALLGNDPTMEERARSMVEAAPDHEPVLQVVRRLFDTQVKALREDPDLWRLRREITLVEPVLAARMLGSWVRVDKVIVDSIIERAHRLAGRRKVDELAVAVEVYAALGAGRAAFRQHVVEGLDGDLDALLDRAYSLLA